MSSEIHVDEPGVMLWFVGHGPAPVLGPCPHACAHRAIGDIAHGPDEDRYVLAVCGDAEDTDGCAGLCRAWLSGEQSERGRWMAEDGVRWLLVDLEHEDQRTLENRRVPIVDFA